MKQFIAIIQCNNGMWFSCWRWHYGGNNDSCPVAVDKSEGISFVGWQVDDGNNEKDNDYKNNDKKTDN